MNKQLHFRVDLAVCLVAFIGTVFGVVAITGHIGWPWPVTTVRMVVNAVITLVIAWKIAEYIRAYSLENDAIGPFMVGIIISLVVTILLFASEHMGALSALFLIAFCVMAYADRLPEKKPAQEQEPVLVIEQEKGN